MEVRHYLHQLSLHKTLKVVSKYIHPVSQKELMTHFHILLHHVF